MAKKRAAEVEEGDVVVDRLGVPESGSGRRHLPGQGDWLGRRADLRR